MGHERAFSRAERMCIVQRMNNGTIVLIPGAVSVLHVLHTPRVGFHLSAAPAVYRLEQLGLESGRAVYRKVS